MKKIILLLIIFCSVSNVKGQLIDSMKVYYNISTSQIFVEGHFQIIAVDPNAIVGVVDTLVNDSVFIEIHFLPCLALPLTYQLDTTVILNRYLPPGPKDIWLYCIWDLYTDTSSCYYNPNAPFVSDTFFTQITVPMSLEESPVTHFIITPNPLGDRLFIDVINIMPIKLQIEIYNISGKLVLASEFRNDLDVSHLPKGMYVIHIVGDHFIEHHKVLKL